MVSIGTMLALLGVIYVTVAARRRRLPESVWFYRALLAAGPASLVALICGWVTTEVGRQPWVVYGVMRTSQAVTGGEGIPVGYALDQALDLTPSDPLSERLQHGVGGSLGLFAVDPRSLGHAPEEGLGIHHFDVGTTREQRREAAGELGHDVVPFLLR